MPVAEVQFRPAESAYRTEGISSTQHLVESAPKIDYQREFAGHYDPIQDRDYYLRLCAENIHPERARQIILDNQHKYVEEYLTKIIHSDYTINAQYMPGFQVSMGRAIERFSREGNHKQTALAYAEYLSFTQIEEYLQANPAGSVVLQSPDRGCDYSYVTVYRRQANDLGEVDTAVDCYRVFNTLQVKSHQQVREALAIGGGQLLNPSEEALGFARAQLQSSDESAGWSISEAALFDEFSDYEPFLILQNAIGFENQVSPEIIAGLYFGDEGSMAEFMQQQQDQVSILVDQFNPDIERIAGLFSLPHQGEGESEFRAFLDEEYKLFVMKAMCHFDRLSAESVFGEQIVQVLLNLNLERQSQSSVYDADGQILRNDLLNVKFNLPKGSCDNDDVSKLSARSMLVIAMKLLRNPMALKDPDLYFYVCETCGEWNAIDVPSGEYVSECGACRTKVERC